MDVLKVIANELTQEGIILAILNFILVFNILWAIIIKNRFQALKGC